METTIYKWYSIDIESDEHWWNPREDDNLWTIVYSHRNYVLWDEELNNHWDWFISDLCIHLEVTRSELMKKYIYIPLYL